MTTMMIDKRRDVFLCNVTVCVHTPVGSLKDCDMEWSGITVSGHTHLDQQQQHQAGGWLAGLLAGLLLEATMPCHAMR